MRTGGGGRLAQALLCPVKKMQPRLVRGGGGSRGCSSGVSTGSSAAAGGATTAAAANAAQLKLKRNRDGGPSASAIAAAADALGVNETESVPKAVVLDLVAADDVDEAKMKPAGASRRIVFEMNAALELVTARET